MCVCFFSFFLSLAHSLVDFCFVSFYRSPALLCVPSWYVYHVFFMFMCKGMQLISVTFVNVHVYLLCCCCYFVVQVVFFHVIRSFISIFHPTTEKIRAFVFESVPIGAATLMYLFYIHTAIYSAAVHIMEFIFLIV